MHGTDVQLWPGRVANWDRGLQKPNLHGFEGSQGLPDGLSSGALAKEEVATCPPKLPEGGGGSAEVGSRVQGSKVIRTPI